MTHRHSLNTQARTGRMLVAAAVSAAIIGAVAVTQPWSPANAAAGANTAMTAMQGGFADLVSEVRPAVVSVEVTRAIRPAGHSRMKWRRPGMEFPELFRYFRSMPEFAIPNRPRAENRRFRLHRRQLGNHRHEPPRGERGELGDGDASGRAQARGRGRGGGSEDRSRAPGGRCRGGAAGGRVREFRPDARRRLGGRGREPVRARRHRHRRASSRVADATSAPAPTTTSCRSTRRSTAATPVVRSSTTPAAVVGVNTAIFSPTGGNVGIGFAIPANMALPVIESLRADGKVDRGWLGNPDPAHRRDDGRGAGAGQGEGRARCFRDG